MPVRVWGVVDGRLIELVAEVDPQMDGGLRIEGLSRERGRPTADRVQAALANSGLLSEAPGIVIRLRPPLVGSSTGLDLPLALAALVAVGRFRGHACSHLFASGRFGMDGRIYLVDAYESERRSC